MNKYGNISVIGFGIGLLACACTLVLELGGVTDFSHGLLPVVPPAYEKFEVLIAFGLILVILLALVNLRVTSPHSVETIQVLALASLLGWVFSFGLILIQHQQRSLWESPFGLYLCILSFFHWSEYVITGITSPSTLSTDSFLLNHSKAYGMAAVASWVEFGLESYFFPGWKQLPGVTMVGLGICVAGEILRKAAMLTAMENFTHVIRSEKVEGHRLITHGVFRLCRHPSYAGWFWWSIGTQILLVNPVCVIAYTIASWNFFCYRITYEEATLYAFFGNEYIQYQEQVPRTGVPLVTGYRLKDKDK